ncbi:MAG: transketolase [Steroidobacteraceae bacterium]
MPTRRDLANAIRALSMDAVQQANSGHPGMPMGMADIAEVLWRDCLKHSPGNPAWPDRDRFVVSNGHGSMLLYSLLHLSGYPLDMDQLRNFRQLGAHTAGHPEREVRLGIETTTGPLGQGLANAVGMALAEKLLAAEFNRPGHEVVAHHTWVFLGDGCLMEGISHEACALAGTWGLGKLICFYDDNGISIDGEVQGWFTDDTPRRFEAYGWQVIRNVDGHDPEAVAKAIRKARRETAKPSLICCKTIIGFGAPTKQGREECHGAALGAEEVARARESLGWPYPPFEVPQDIRDAWDARSRGRRAENKWKRAMKAYREAHPELAAELERRLAGRLAADALQAAAAHAAECQAKRPALATRQASQAALNALGSHCPELLGGSADLTGSNLTRIAGSAEYTRERGDGRYLHYGVREFGMAAIMNGIALHGGFIPYGGTFLVFSDYARNAIRMSAMMGAGVIQVLTHDSIGLGEDGPTHQPVEQLASLRLIPGLECWRPCDAAETAVAWQAAIERRDGPSCLVLTRQAVPHQARDDHQLKAVARGGYVLLDCDGTPDCVLIGTGSEVDLAMRAAAELSATGRRVRVVSMPCVERFAAQDQAWRDAVLPPGVRARVAVEAGATQGWWRWVGSGGRVIGLDRFGASAPAKQLFEHFGITAASVAAAAREAMEA